MRFLYQTLSRENARTKAQTITAFLFEDHDSDPNPVNGTFSGSPTWQIYDKIPKKRYFYTKFQPMKRFLLLLCPLLLSIHIARSQSVGLVLSGGGAKGLYHVGIIKALEQNNVPIDYISGASMGAIVGAMYVSGYSPDEMIRFFLTDSVSKWLGGKIPQEYSYYFKRFDPTPEMIAIGINPDTTKNATLGLPTNLISPYLIDLAFINMVSEASAVAAGNFDSLLVPFRCVATDFFNRKSVTFRTGSLPFAVRASMTIPLYFKPLEKDSILLYDGGVYNNFPWQPLVEDFKPDILIGGVCAKNFKNPSQNNVVGQIMTMITKKTDYSLPDSTDILIAREFPDVGMLDYDKAAYIVSRGYEDAMRAMPDILRRINRRVTPEQMQRRRIEFKSREHPLIFDSITIEGLNHQQTEYVKRQLGMNLHKLVTWDYIENKYLKILSAEIFTGEFPEVTFNPASGFYQLRLRMHTKPSLKVSLGGNLSSTALNQLFVALSYNRVGRSASNYRLNGYLGTYYNSVQAGGRHDFYTNFPFYIEYNYAYESINKDTYNAQPYYRNKDFRYKDHSSNIVNGSFAVPVLNNSALRASLSLAQFTDDYFQTYHTSADSPDRTDFQYVSLAAEVQTNSLNYPIYSTQGVNQLFRLKYTTGLETYRPGSTPTAAAAFSGMNRNWWQVNFLRQQYLSMNKWFTLGYTIDVAISNHPNFANRLATALTQPAFTPTPLSQTVYMPEYRSSAYLGVGISPTFKFLASGNLYLTTYAYAFMPKEIVYENSQWQRLSLRNFRDHARFIFGGSLVYQTAIGPASLTLEKYSTGRENWNIMFNFGFAIFGKQR